MNSDLGKAMSKRDYLNTGRNINKLNHLLIKKLKDASVYIIKISLQGININQLTLSTHLH